jgi:tyrosyl-tRNA synthetase
MTKLMFGSHCMDLKASDVISSFMGDPRLVISSIEDITGIPVAKLAAKYGLVSSNCGYPLNVFKSILTQYPKAVARNLVASRGLYLNNQAIQDAQYKITPSNLLDNKFVILRAGKDKILVLLASG